jgi:hypothetical protein
MTPSIFLSGSYAGISAMYLEAIAGLLSVILFIRLDSPPAVSGCRFLLQPIAGLPVSFAANRQAAVLPILYTVVLSVLWFPAGPRIPPPCGPPVMPLSWVPSCGPPLRMPP